MTEFQFEMIEAAVGFFLLDKYRRVAAAPPFRPVRGDLVYWFFNDPNKVIEATIAPLADGDYDMTGWQYSYLTIGESGAGDLYVMDTAVADLPVHCLSHESHRIELEYKTFAAFVEDWVKDPEKFEAKFAEEKVRLRTEWNVRLRRAAIFVFCAIPASIVLAAIVTWVLLWLRK